MTTLLTINLIAVVLFAWAVLFRIVPSYATSRYRYRLWRLRDSLADDVRHGEFQTPDAAKRLISFVELAIEDAEDLTALNVALFSWVNRDEPLEDDPFNLGGSDEDAARLRPMVDELRSALLAKALLGSPSGWLLTAVVMPVVAVAVIRRSERPAVLRATANRIGNDLQRSNRLDDPHEHLYQHVG